MLELAEVAVPIASNYLSRIIDELVQNAFKFSSPGSRVFVRLQSVPGSVVLTVTDQGRGFTPEQLLNLGAYMQFDRKLHEQQGLGLGLIIARRLVELHGGSLSVQSEPGEQTAVAAKLPAGALTAATESL